jgi:hypothetical protein
MIPHQRDPVTLAARLIAPLMTTLAAKETARSGRSHGRSQGDNCNSVQFPTETARRRQDDVFHVGARLGKIKREELDNASTPV